MSKYKGTYQFTIEEQDIGHGGIIRPIERICNCNCPKCNGKTVWYLYNVIGLVLPIDIGKQVYLNDDILQVENEEQRNVRLGV